MKIVTVEQMRALEQESVRRGVSLDALMEHAGLAVARKSRQVLREVKDARVIVLVGPGNNGGDGLVAARYLAEWGARVVAYLCASRPEGDSKLELAQERGVLSVEATLDKDQGELQRPLVSAQLVIDAVFGTGGSRPLTDPVTRVLRRTAAEKARRPSMTVLALDVPSGLHADTGAVDPATLPADLTVTLGYPKLGLFLFPGAEAVGRLETVDIGIPPDLGQDIPLELMTPEQVRDLLPRRPLSAHKGTFGRVLVVAGSRNYVGAAYLACTGAARSGAGYVTLATPASIQPILAGKLTEVTYMPLPELADGVLSPEAGRVVGQSLEGFQVLLVGCGLGQSPATEGLVRETILSGGNAIPQVLDADALNLLSSVPRWWERIRAPTAVTPHPGEMGRLLGKSVAEVQGDRIRVAQEASRRWGVAVVLKGAFTVVASPQGQTRISPFTNPGLASAGTGDVLAGVIAGLMAQGLAPFDAACAGVYLHGEAGELVRLQLGDTGMLASDLLPMLPKALKALREHQASEE